MTRRAEASRQFELRSGVSTEAVQVRVSLWRSTGMRALVGVVALQSAGFSLTLASLPVYAVSGGARESTAGLVTTVLMVVTIAVQGAVPSLTARFGQARVLAAGLVAIGVPSPLYALHDGLGWISMLSGLRGAGFAIVTVLGTTLTAQIAPPDRRGEAIGIYGLAMAVSTLICVPAGAALALDGRMGWLAWLAASPLLGLALIPRLMRGLPARPSREGVRSARSAAWAAGAPSLVVFVVILGSAGLVTFLPIERPEGGVSTAALLLYSLTGAITRWGAGWLADRFGSRVLLPAGLGAGAIGLAVIALGLTAGTHWILVGAALFGVGYGTTQNLTLVAAFSRAGESGMTSASAMWNAAVDSGLAVGALLLGFVAVGIGLSWTFVVVAGVVAMALPLAIASTRPSPSRS